MRAWRRKAGLLVWVIAATAGWAGGESQVSFRPVELRDAVEVAGDVLTLADLLPAHAPEALRKRRALISLGKVPLPGNVRVISRATLEQALRSAPDLLDTLVIPNEIAIRRACRRLEIGEVLPALRKALEREGLDVSALRLLSKAELETPVWVASDDPGLEVSRLEFDPLLRKTRVEIQATKERHAVPFFVTVSARLETPATSIRPKPRAGQMASRGRSPLPVLIQMGHPARLVAEGGGIRISTRVVPLERGVRGQRIRVRSLDRGRLLRAEVVDRGLLHVVR